MIRKRLRLAWRCFGYQNSDSINHCGTQKPFIVSVPGIADGHIAMFAFFDSLFDYVPCFFIRFLSPVSSFLIRSRVLPHLCFIWFVDFAEMRYPYGDKAPGEDELSWITWTSDPMCHFEIYKSQWTVPSSCYIALYKLQKDFHDLKKFRAYQEIA